MLKKLLLLLLSVVITMSGLCITASALSDRPVYAPEITVGSWASPSSAATAERSDGVFKIKTRVKNMEIGFYITFPSEGGFRLYSDYEGIYRPESVDPVNYLSADDSEVVMQARDGTVVTVGFGSNAWTVTAKRNASDRGFMISSDRIFFGYSSAGEYIRTKATVALNSDEIIYGGGERFNGINQNGSKINLWNTDVTYHIAPDDTEFTSAYKNVPLFHSNDGYSMFYNSTYDGSADIGNANSDSFTIELGGKIFDIYVWTGEPLENLSDYCELTGNTFIPPKWAFSYWAGGANALWRNDGDENYIPILQNVLKKYKELGITNLQALYGEYITYDPTVYNILKRTDTRMFKWYDGRIPYSDMIDLLPNVAEDDLPIVRSSLNLWRKLLFNDSVFIDYTAPYATDLVKAYNKKYVDWGVRGLMVDMGELVPYDTVFYNGSTGAEMHNYWTYYYTKCVNEAFTDMLGKDFMLFARSGCAGSQQYAALFSGDQKATYVGLRQQLSGLLTSNSSGYSVYGGDIGGFYGTPTSDCYLRWLEFSCFEPLMREHGTDILGNNPWNFGDMAEETFKELYWLRENMVNYLYSNSVISNKDCIPMAQNMLLAYPEDTALASVEDQYLFCNTMLVCPVTSENQYYRSVTFPTGTWYDLWTGEQITGSQTMDVDAPINAIPVYLKSGTTMPVTVASTFKLGDALADDNKISALAVTPSENAETTEYYTDENTLTTFSNKKTGDNSFTISYDGTTDATAILAYGVLAESVKIDGSPVDELSQQDIQDGWVGYCYDGHKCTVITLPEGWKNVEISGLSTSREALNLINDSTVVTDAFNDTENTDTAAVKSGDPGTIFNCASKRNNYLCFDLGKTQKISEINLKWTYQFADKYSVQVSEDGENWESIYEAEKFLGGIDRITFDTVKARYIRVCDFPNSACQLYGVEAYSPVSGISKSSIEVTVGDFLSQGVWAWILAIGIALLVVTVIVFASAVLIFKLKNRTKKQQI